MGPLKQWRSQTLNFAEASTNFGGKIQIWGALSTASVTDRLKYGVGDQEGTSPPGYATALKYKIMISFCQCVLLVCFGGSANVNWKIYNLKLVPNGGASGANAGSWPPMIFFTVTCPPK